MIRRGMILLVVLIVVTIAAFAGVSAAYMARAEVESVNGGMRRVQSRALAWSGVQAVMAELAQQRSAILRGGEAQVTPEWDLFTDSAGRRAVVRIIAGEDEPPFGASPSRSRLVQSEQAKLDVNTATPGMLIALGLDEPLAQAIIAGRGQAGYSSIGDLLKVSGVTPELLFGAAWDGRSGDEETFEEPAEPSEAGANDLAIPAAGGLSQRLTVFSFDPNLQAGTSDPRSEGEPRININAPWSEDLGAAITNRFGPEAAARAKALISEEGTRITTLGALITLAAANGADPETLADQIDAFTVVSSPFVQGLVDLNLAPAEVLACIPGISTEAAERIVEVRAGMSEEVRAGILWPLEQDILTQDEMVLAADHLTTRSCQWRVTVENGFLPTGNGDSWEDLAEVELLDRVVLEAVIDIAAARPRVAYLRDITLLPVAQRLAADAGAIIEEEEARVAIIDERPPPLTAPMGPPARSRAFGGRSDRPDPGARIREPSGEGPIERDAAEAATDADSAPTGDPRIGRWTPGRAGKEEP